MERRFSKLIRVLVIGENCTDKFVYCETSRFSPEAPVPVLNPIQIVESSGMSGNVVRNLMTLGTWKYNLEGIEIKHIHQNQTITKTRFVEKKSNHMFFRLDEGEKYIDTFNSEINFQEFDFVIVSDYNKGFLSDEDLINIGKNSKLSILDSKRKLSKRIVDSFSFVKLNEKESNHNKDISNLNNIITTLGSEGSRYQDKVYPSPNPQETIDVSGAGDTFTASFILKYYQTKDVEQSIVFANKMSAIVVSKRGVSTP